VQDELSTDLCLNGLNADFLDNVLLDSDILTTASNTEFNYTDCTVMGAFQSDHMYSLSHSDSMSEHQSSCSPPSAESHASLYSYSSCSPLADVSSSASPSEHCASPLDGTTEDLTMQGMLTVVQPSMVLLQGDGIIDMVTSCDETIEAVTDDSGLISVGRQPLLFECFVNSVTKMLHLFI